MTFTPNAMQKQAIETVDGPLLIIAGPGTGKTATLVQRIIYMIKDKGIRPEQIFTVTFTEKAAKELVTRISNAMLENGIDANLSDMQIGTFHSLFGRFLVDYIDKTDLQKNFVQIDELGQYDLIYRELNRFKKLTNYHSLDHSKWQTYDTYNKQWKDKTRWATAKIIARMVDQCREELVSVTDLQGDERLETLAVAEILEEYEKLIKEKNLLDFSGIMNKTYVLLHEHPVICRELSDKYPYLMVDEYQDTNTIQDAIMEMLAGERKNLCVVGDDDQSLYRFRGANISNILSFEKRFPRTDGKSPVRLEENYRSTDNIIDFYNRWMNDTDENGGAKGRLEWGGSRLSKVIRSRGGTAVEGPVVSKITDQSEEAWCNAVCGMIRDLKENGQITDYNQVAVLTQVAVDPLMTQLIDTLEQNGVPVFAPRFRMFFGRKEIKELIGCLLRVCPVTLSVSENKINEVFITKDLANYYEQCIAAAEAITDPGLNTWISEKKTELAALTADAHYGFSDMVYQLLQFSPFTEYLSDDGADDTVGDVVRERAARNIALMMDAISYYETSKNMTDGFKRLYYKRHIQDFFADYLRHRRGERFDEYEDEEEYAPRGCVSFMTIHQSKGLEFPVVITALQEPMRYRPTDAFMDKYVSVYMQRTSVENVKYLKQYDFWRLYYVAFSRAKNLLVLAMEGEKVAGIGEFRKMIRNLPEYNARFLQGCVFDPISDVNLKKTYSFTSHLGVYETCPRQYYFFRKLGYTPCRTGNTFFGILVHETIEDVNKAAIAGQTASITKDNVEMWLNANYSTLMLSEHYHLSNADKSEALRQVMRYVDYAGKDWSRIKETEVEVKDVRPDYILLGKVDLVQGEGDTYELVDFKTGEKPADSDPSEQLAHYKEQLQTYSHLIMQQNPGKKISKAHLFYTKVKNGDPRITIPVDEKTVKTTLNRFDEIIHKIENNDFSGYACDNRTCSNCDLRHYCSKDPASPVHGNH